MREQYSRILNALRRSGGNTTVGMQRDLNIVDVRKRITELRRLGHFIRDRREDDSARAGWHNRYWLEEGTPAAGRYYDAVKDGLDWHEAMTNALEPAQTGSFEPPEHFYPDLREA